MSVLVIGGVVFAVLGLLGFWAIAEEELPRLCARIDAHRWQGIPATLQRVGGVN